MMVNACSEWCHEWRRECNIGPTRRQQLLGAGRGIKLLYARISLVFTWRYVEFIAHLFIHCDDCDCNSKFSLDNAHGAPLFAIARNAKRNLWSASLLDDSCLSHGHEFTVVRAALDKSFHQAELDKYGRGAAKTPVLMRFHYFGCANDNSAWSVPVCARIPFMLCCGESCVGQNFECINFATLHSVELLQTNQRAGAKFANALVSMSTHQRTVSNVVASPQLHQYCTFCFSCQPIHFTFHRSERWELLKAFNGDFCLSALRFFCSGRD